MGVVTRGGGGAAGDATPVFSTLDFPVRSAYDTMMTRSIGLNLAGTDNAVIAPTVTPVDWPSWSRLPPPPPELVPADLRWIGTITAQKQAVNVLVTTYTPAVTATTRVDYIIKLKSLRDGVPHEDFLSVFFDAEYRPLAAVTMQSRLWTWSTPQSGLPVSGTIGVSSGGALAKVCSQPDVASLTEIGCSGSSGSVPAIWSLQPDTAQTGFITFSYRAPFFDSRGGADAATVNIKTKIDSTGAFRGAEYERTEGSVTIRLRG